MEGFKYLDHTADIAVEISGSSLESLFSTAAEAMKATALEFSSSEAPFELHFDMEAVSPEELLVEFLSELNFILNSRKLVFSRIKNLSIMQDSVYRLQAAIYFADFSPSVHKMKVEIKAITFYQMNIEQKDDTFTTRVIFDV